MRQKFTRALNNRVNLKDQRMELPDRTVSPVYLPLDDFIKPETRSIDDAQNIDTAKNLVAPSVSETQTAPQPIHIPSIPNDSSLTSELGGSKKVRFTVYEGRNLQTLR